MQYYKFCISGFLTWLSLYNFSFFVSVVLSVWLKCAEIFQLTDRNITSRAGFSPLSSLATSGRRFEQTHCVKQEAHQSHVEFIDKVPQMNVVIFKLLTSS